MRWTIHDFVGAYDIVDPAVDPVVDPAGDFHGSRRLSFDSRACAVRFVRQFSWNFSNRQQMARAIQATGEPFLAASGLALEEQLADLVISGRLQLRATRP